MRKIYGKFLKCEGSELIITLVEKLRKSVDQDEYNIYIEKKTFAMDVIRKLYNLPNNLCTLTMSDDGIPFIVMFEHNLDGNYYDITRDEKGYYIEVEKEGK